MRKQIELGKRYFTETFGRFPEVAYNVDSFGHAASLPTMMHDAGQRFYVMMRPGEGEMKLPARLFRWRGHEGGPEVTTFRIARAYTTRGVPGLDHIKASLTELPDGIDHTMCFVGVGDHGGGATEQQIAWCREHQSAIDGVKLEFSYPRKFFDAIGEQLDQLPVVTGELQHHAIGCYSVHRASKTALRRAEFRAKQAEAMRQTDPAPPADIDATIDRAWHDVCFHHFHDTLGGTCIPSAYQQVEAQLGRAFADCDDYLQMAMRRKMVELPDDQRQRLVLHNPGDEPFDDYIECEPWFEWRHWEDAWRLVDDAGQAVPLQRLHSEAMAGSISRLLLRAKLEPGQMRCWHIERDGGPEPTVDSPVEFRDGAMHNQHDVGLTFDPSGVQLSLGDLAFGPRLALIDDHSDTWSHDIDRFQEGPAQGATWGPASFEDRGPLMASMMQRGTIGRSDLLAEWRVYADLPLVELRLRVNWREKLKLLKLVVPTVGGEQRLDGIMGGQLARANDGAERPLADWTLCTSPFGQLGVVAPDCFALDGRPDRLRFTLLRSCYLAHHDPHHAGSHARAVVADQGEHTFTFRFCAGLLADQLAAMARNLHEPPIYADLTRGMPT